MAIEYDLVPGPGRKAGSDNEVQRLVPKVVTHSTVSFKQMAEDIAHATSFTEADVVGMMDAIAKFAAQYLNSSKHVELAGLGTLSLGIALQGRCRGTSACNHHGRPCQAAPAPREPGHPHGQAHVHGSITRSLRTLPDGIPL